METNRTPPLPQYLELLKCQYLLQRIGDGDELDNVAETSHWRGYVTSLQEVIYTFRDRYERHCLANLV